MSGSGHATRSRRGAGLAALTLSALSLAGAAGALDKKDVTYKVYQFAADAIPRIDGRIDDWAMVPESYVVRMDQFRDDTRKHPVPDPKTLDIRVKVGWVAGLNRLYFLYEATDDYWDFAQPGLHNDTFEVVVDGDASGGPLIDKGENNFWTSERVGQSAAEADDRIGAAESHWAIHGVHAQNYHVFTPARDKDWALAWGSPTWIKELPWANAAQTYSFKPGEGGKLVLEFWITPFDYAGPEGPERAVPSVLAENRIIGLGFAVIDYDDVNAKGNNGFWNLSTKHTMYGQASELCAFRLMPRVDSGTPLIEAQWSWKVVDMGRRLVAFQDLSRGRVTSWKWDFGDGQISTEQHPLHVYAKPDNYVVVLDVLGPDGKSRRSKVWDVQLK